MSAFNRNPWTSRELYLAGRSRDPIYDEDGLRTDRSHQFVRDPRFVAAYARAVRAGGFDYGVRWRTHAILWAAETAARHEGAFVECGTGRGFMASAICEYLAWGDRAFYLFDTFEPSDVPETAPYYADGPEPVAANFRPWPGVQVVAGRIPEVFAGTAISRVAFLHVDLNAAAPEAAAVRHFWPLLTSGGVVVLDDYGSPAYAASRQAADGLAAELGFNVLACPTGQGIVVKP